MSFIISNYTMKRLSKDIADIIKYPLHDEGIYYQHDEDNLLLGHAMIYGPKDTIYESGYYMFKFEYPETYPSLPPKVTFLTNKNNIRFHPNLYRNGKCCLSILNTWSGEQWSACQSIRTILLQLLILFNNKPLLHEPGIIETHRDFLSYNKVIEYNNIDIAIFNMLNNNLNIESYKLFKNDIKKLFSKNKKNIREKILKLKLNNNYEYNIQLYKMNGICNYKELHNKLKEI